MIKKFLVLIFVTSSLFANGEALVNVATLEKSQINPLTQFIGTVKFENKSTLASESSGLVKKINFEIGKKVKKGDLLLSIDSSILDAQISSKKASLSIAKLERENAKRDFARYATLLEKKSIAQKVYDDAKLGFELSKQKVFSEEASFKELKIQKNKKFVKAPYSGVVVEKSINLDEWVNSGTPIAKIVNTKDLEMNFNLPMGYIKGLNKSKEYEIELANKTIKAKLYAAIPSGDTLTRTFPVRFKASVNNGFVFEGAQAKVKLAKNNKTEALTINRDAVIKRFGSDVIFTINDKSMAVMIPVQIIGYEGNKVGIQAQGLKAGMKIVVKGNERVFPNQPVKVLNK